MDIIGAWRPKFMQGKIIKTELQDLDAQRAAETDPEEIRHMDKLLNTRYVFRENGDVDCAMYIGDDVPQEAIDEEIAKGAEIVGRLYIMEHKKWKEEDGKILSQISTSGENMTEDGQLDNEAYGEVKIKGDMLMIDALFGYYYLVKAD